ncbi:alpha-amylase family glycosyl hydrolase [Sinomonas sp. R1AF57]|uniref:alpha-amylase family glycosyl hydrolase n=1 Tax=Sinomonas sp. R1AF57 TaxID=2020377 RepID=UPI000B5ECB8E|nr:alpha-amylase family glycosyl hydrolase [Sinomonas sp. R1AF57]ASN50887.1 alpha-amylase [Sinomonas sp. R1AF57]
MTNRPFRPRARGARRAGAAAAAVVLAAGLLTQGATTALAGPAPSPASPATGAAHSFRTAAGTENYYFVMTDRFANGTAANDQGGLGADPMVSGFDPANKGFYHGGDLAGLTGKLDYIQGLGTTAIWLTPSFKNKAVQPQDKSAGYHGYWITDFTQIDPHLGTNAELGDLITKAHERGMKVYFDIITNHTADVIKYTEGDRKGYISKTAAPYRDAAGNVFDDAAVADQPSFPVMDPATSFPYHPYVSPGEENLKVPAWLNDVSLYHNRGDSTFAGESANYGDFSGLDDLFTENPTVLNGFIDVYRKWIGDFGIDGFRIDTMKHVNDEFWQKFSPAILDYAHSVGKKDFFMFGEVYDTSRDFTSKFTTSDGVRAVLDFPFQQAARSYASASSPATTLQKLFQGDDWYTTATSNVYQLPTFLGNHDMGRIGSFIAQDNPNASDAEKVARDRLATELMYFSRGNPIVYYGDEQGFTGAGGDQLARQDMFASKTPEYLADTLLGTTATHASDNYVTTHPLYTSIADLAKVVKDNPALRTGAHQDRYADATAGVYAFSRIDATAQREYVVALNNTAAPRTAAVPTYLAQRPFAKVFGDGAADRLKTAADKTLTVTVPAFSTVVYESAGRIPDSAAAPVPVLGTPKAAGGDNTRVNVTADLPRDSFYEVTFQARTPGGQWENIGTDDTYPYQVFHATKGMTPGTPLEYRALTLDNAGHTAASAATVSAVVPTPVDPDAPKGPAPQPLSVTVAGDYQHLAGCAGDWDPACEATMAQYDPVASEWRLTLDLPAGTYQVKAALNGSWTQNYGDGGAPNGANISVRHPGGKLTFTYRHDTHLTTVAEHAAQPSAVAVPGTLNTAMGCAADWDPACPQTQLAFDGAQGVWRGTYTLPAGSYSYKAALNRSWDVNYGVGGAVNGPNIGLDHPGGTVTFSYNDSTHLVTAGWPVTQPASVNLPGTYQHLAGCAGDWDPACPATSAVWDPRSQGWILRLASLPAGSYSFKAALNGSWDLNYGVGGALNGPNIGFDHPGGAIAFRYDPATHLVTAVSG